jgi:hypothetical protein
MVIRIGITAILMVIGVAFMPYGGGSEWAVVLLGCALVSAITWGTALFGRAERPRRYLVLVALSLGLHVLVIGALSSALLTGSWDDPANKYETKVRLSKISGQVLTYATLQTPPALPASLEDLVAPGNGLTSLLKASDTKDAWGQDIIYTKKGHRSYELRSPGADGQVGTEDDIVYEE